MITVVPPSWPPSVAIARRPFMAASQRWLPASQADDTLVDGNDADTVGAATPPAGRAVENRNPTSCALAAFGARASSCLGSPNRLYGADRELSRWYPRPPASSLTS